MTTDAVDNVDLPYGRDSASQQKKITALQERLEVLKTQNEGMCDKLLDTNAENNKYQQKLERLTHENKKLKQSPLFVATVQEITDERVIIGQHGNNQEALTEVTDKMHEELEPDAHVTVNNSLSIIKRLDKETDVRARVIQVEHSPNVTYEDIGDLEEQMQEVRETIKMPLDRPKTFAGVGIDPPLGVLLYDPPGTGKAVLVRAIANQMNASFIKMAGSRLVRKLIDEDTKLVRDPFGIARENEPAAIFIDEVDAIASKRTDSKTSGDAKAQRVMMRLLAEMDDFDEHSNIHIIAATDRFDMLDLVILRPGRFDRLIEMPRPNKDGRGIIFQTHTRKMSVSSDVDFVKLAGMADNVSGADIKAICTEAGMLVIRDDRTEIFMRDFVGAWGKIQRETSDETEVPRAFA